MRHLLLAPALLLALAFPAFAQKIPLDDLSAYLNRLTTAKASFTQTNADGSASNGTIYIRRPGRVRFEYEKPDRSLVIAGSGQVAIFDDKSNQAPEQYPLKRTPLNLILADKVDLGRARMVTGHTEADGFTRVTAQDPDNPEYGSIELIFTPDPVELRQWIITDDSGGQTSVTLRSMEKGVRMRAGLFDINAETERRMR